MAAPTVEEPILSRLNRLDNILKQLEDIRSVNHSPKSSDASSETLTSDGQPSSADFSPKNSLEKHCRPMNEVMMEVETKGTLFQRLVHAEDRILKLCLQLEEEFEMERSRELRASSGDHDEHYKIKTNHSHSPKKSLKQFVKSCVGAKKKHKNNA